MTEMVAIHEVVFDEIGTPVNYRIIDCNAAYTAITGISREDAVGKLATEVYQQEEAPYLKEFTTVGISGIPFEYTTYYPPMDKHFMISVVSPKKNQFATITTDITAIQQIQDAISSKNKELENYLYVASHDLRSPLVNIQGFSQRLQKQLNTINSLFENEELNAESKKKIDEITKNGIPKTLEFIFSNAAKMDKLITGLLQISRTGNVKMNVQKIDMNKLIDTIIRNLSFQLEEIGAKINYENLHPCYGDIVLLSQLFTNLIENAIKYRSRERPLEILIKSSPMYKKVSYTIQDNGIGISQRHIERIWDVFYRVNTQNEIPGEGIGLSIVKRITDKHHGKVRLHSEEGIGSTFFIELNNNPFSE
jgi:signal transduction histidine kinase